jgi:hypothetical protein
MSNIRSCIGKEGYDFSVIDGEQLGCEDKEGYYHSTQMTKAEIEIYKIGYEQGKYEAIQTFQDKVKDLFGIN